MTTRSPLTRPRAFIALASRQVRSSSSRVGDLGDGAVVGLEDDRRLVAETGLDVAVEAVVRGVERAVLEPLEERRRVGVEDAPERRPPRDQLPRQARPVAFVVARRLVAERLVGRHAGHPGVLRRRGRAAGRRAARRSCGCLQGSVIRLFYLMCACRNLASPQAPDRGCPGRPGECHCDAGADDRCKRGVDARARARRRSSIRAARGSAASWTPLAMYCQR